MNWYDTCSLVTQKECCMSSKRLFLNGNTSLPNLDTANSNIILVKILFSLFKVPEPIKINLFICSMITKDMEFFHSFHFLAIIRFICDINDLLQAKSTSTTYNISDVIFFSDIMEEEISFGNLFFHFFYNQLLICY